MSSILDRLNLLVRSNLNDLSSGRPGSSGPLRDMESSLRDARRQLHELRTGESNLSRQIRELRDRADSWEDRAMLALRNGDEDLAREALLVKNETMREAERLRDQLDDQRAYIRDMQSSLEALEMKLESARGRMEASTGRTDRRSSGAPRTERDWDAEMRRRMASRDGGSSEPRERRDAYSPRERRPVDDYDARYSGPLAGTDGELSDSVANARQAFRDFDRMSSKIDEMEAQVDAMSELADVDDPLVDPRRVELDRIFDRMERQKKTNDDLSDLKARFSDD